MSSGPLTLESFNIDHDEDGDGCTDWNELGTDVALGGLNDPFNPNDCSAPPPEPGIDGLYDISQPFGKWLRTCKAYVQSYDTRVFCYTDGPWQVNKLGYAPPAWYIAVRGDGLPGGGLDGGGPWWPAIPAVGAPETNCGRYPGVDDDIDGTVNDGCPSEGFADVDSSHTVLAGALDGPTNTLRLAGCFADEDASEALGNIYVEWSWNVQTGAGASDTWTSQTLADCSTNGPYAWGTYSGVAGAPTFASMPLAALKRPLGPMGEAPDSDGDGIPDVVELRDEAGGGGNLSNCGGRDPFNPYDWYDVNQDGVIDLVNDITGVIDHWQPTAGGAPPYDIVYDRPPTMTGALGHWNRGAPDGVIDMSNDILGVIDQWHPTPC